MARQDAANLLASAGLPVVYYRWPEGSTPEFPCIRYIYAGDAGFRADDGEYAPADAWSATLVSEWKDDASEAAIEAAFAAAGVIATKHGDVYVQSERLNQVEYTFTLPR